MNNLKRIMNLKVYSNMIKVDIRKTNYYYYSTNGARCQPHIFGLSSSI